MPISSPAIKRGQLGNIDNWYIDEASKKDIDAILKRCVTDPVSPQFMAPPLTRP